MNSPIRVSVTIDTEEDDWGIYKPLGATVRNINLLPSLRGLWDRYGVRPTYFVNYPPLASEEAAGILAELGRSTECEMAVHCHPWNTPPIKESMGRPVTMMADLSVQENLDKIGVLTDLFRQRFQAAPVSFRAGRWGFGPAVAEALPALGYLIDSSVSPFVDWTSLGGTDFSRAPQAPYRFFPSEPLTPASGGTLVEVPTSVGFLRGDQLAAQRLRTRLERSWIRHSKVVGVLDLAGLLTRRWLSPETSSRGELIQLAGALAKSGLTVLDLTFHSSSLIPGATPFVRTEEEKVRFLGRIEAFLRFCSDQGYGFTTVREIGLTV